MEDKPQILIVDDNISLRRTMSLILTRKGFAVTMAQDGPEAISRVEEQPFDMIFMDIKMPLMNGVEAYRRIKRVRPEVAVVMMTAYALEELVREALQEGAHGIIYKPLDIERVLAIIEEARKARQAALILIVDDDAGTCATLKNILIKEGYQVRIAPSGEEAIAQAQERAYDLVLVDVKLPTIDGLATYLAIKETNPEVVAIMMTGYRYEVADLVEEALSHGACACLFKPLDMEELLKLIEGVWDGKQRAHPDR